MKTALVVKIGAAVVGAVAIAAVGYALLSDGDGGGGPARAWVDEPLSGITVPLAPVEVIAHAYDEGGVDEVQLSVAGDEVETVTPDAAGQELADATFTWVPPAPGVYVLEVVGTGADSAGAVGRATITVSEDVAPPPTTTTTSPGSSTTATTSSTTTAVPPGGDAPGPARPPGRPGQPPDDTPPTVSVTGPASIADIDLLVITATASDDRQIERIEIWARTGTSGPFAVQQVCPRRTTCTWESIQSPGTVQYYAVAYDTAGNKAQTPTRSVTVVFVPR